MLYHQNMEVQLNSFDSRLTAGHDVSFQNHEIKTHPHHGIVIISLKPQSDNNILFSDTSKTNSNLLQQQDWKKYIGIIFTLISTIFCSLVTLTIKLIPGIHPITQSIWRFAIKTILNIILIVSISMYNRIVSRRQNVRNYSMKCSSDNNSDSKDSNDDDTNSIFKYGWPSSSLTATQCLTMMGKIVVIGAFGTASTLLESTALNYLTVADATVMTYIQLVFVLILAHFLIREKCSIISSLMAVLIIAGIGIITRPPFLTGTTEFNMMLVIGLCFKLADGLCNSIYAIAIRNFRHVHFAYVHLIVGIVGLVLSITSSFSLQLFVLPKDLKEIELLIGLGVLHFLSSMFLILALQHEKAGPVTLLRTVNVPLIFLWQIIFLNEYPDEWTILGSVVVCFGVIVTSVRKWVEELEETSGIKQKLWFCLK